MPKANTRLDRPSRLKRKVLFKKKTGNKKKIKKIKKIKRRQGAEGRLAGTRGDGTQARPAAPALPPGQKAHGAGPATAQ